MTERPEASGIGWWGATLGASAALLIAFQGLIYPRISDPDAFYHIGHAAQYLSDGPFDSSFRWTAWSVISEAGADLWYGLHMLLLPFATIADPAVGIRVAAVVLALTGLAAIALVARHEGWVGGPVWPLLFLLAVPNVLYRYLSVRPEVLSVPFAILLMAAVARRRPVAVAGVAALLTWVHLSMWWLTVGVVVVTLGVDLALRRGGSGGLAGPAAAESLVSSPAAATESRAGVLPVAVAAILGIGVGAVARPEPLGGLRLAWIQIAELLFEKSSGAPLTFATELSPIGFDVLIRMAWPLLIVWIVAVVAGAGGSGRDEAPIEARSIFWSSTLLAAGFLVLTLVVARRSLVYWTAFSIPGLAVVVTWHLGELRTLASRALLVSTIVLFAWSVRRNDLNARFIAIQPDRLAGAAAFLAEASEPDDLVFNTHWDAFGPLFARNRVNRYLGGMDPIFQYARDERRYWMFHHFSTGAATAVTCAASDCAPGEGVDVWEAIRGEFDARWVLTEPARDGGLIRYLDTDSRFRRVFDGRDGIVFEVAVSTRPAGG